MMASHACKPDQGHWPVRVLVIDDQSEALWLEELLAEAAIPAEISHVSTLADALAIISNGPVDAVLFRLRCAGPNWTKMCQGVARASGNRPIAVLEANDVLEPSEAIASRVGSAFYEEQITPETINRILLLTVGRRQGRSGRSLSEHEMPFPDMWNAIVLPKPTESLQTTSTARTDPAKTP